MGTGLRLQPDNDYNDTHNTSFILFNVWLCTRYGKWRFQLVHLLEAFGGKAAHHNFPHMLGIFKVSNICALCMLSILLNFQD
jgi:hypothetical protein